MSLESIANHKAAKIAFASLKNIFEMLMTLAGTKMLQAYEPEHLSEIIHSAEAHYEVKDVMFSFRYVEFVVVARCVSACWVGQAC